MPRPFAAQYLPPVSTVAEARAAGLTAAQLRHPSLGVPTRGLRVRGQPRTIDETVRPLSAVLPPGSAFSHLTAARLLDLPTPTWWSAPEPVHVVHPTAQIRRPGVVGHRAARPTVTVHGLRVTTGPATWRDLADSVPLDDLVAVADAVLHLRLGSLADLRRQAADRRPGATAARAAVALARLGAESPKETQVRLVVVRAGLPQPQLNRWVVDDEGIALGRVDMLWPAQRIVVEYEGDEHRTNRAQWRRDISRIRRLEAMGYRVLRVTDADLVEPLRTAAFIADLTAALGSPAGIRCA